MRLVSVLFVAMLLAGCGSASGTSIDAAADATAAETSRFETSYRITEAGGGQAFTFHASGVFDYPNERGLMEIDEHDALESLPVEFRVFGTTGYLRWVVDGKSYWVKEDDLGTSSDPLELLTPFPGSPTKPTDVLTRVLSVTDKIQTLGKEDVRGAETTHYRARVDVKELAQQLPTPERPGSEAERLWSPRFVPVDIWIDEENRARRITIDKPADEYGNHAMLSTVELFDYDVEVELEPPPTDELITQEEFQNLPGSPLGLEVESGEAETVSPEVEEKP